MLSLRSGAVCRSVITAALLISLSGCAASRALNEPAKRDYDVLKPGSSRDLVRAELGEPLKSVGREDCDVFAFQEGSSGWKYLRAMGYSILDLGTLGISEIVTNPVEASVGKDKIRLRVCYNGSQDVIYSEKLEVGKPAELITGAYPPPPIAVAAPPPAAPADVIPLTADTGKIDATASPVSAAAHTAPAAEGPPDAATTIPAPPATSTDAATPAPAPAAAAPVNAPGTY